jgi:hypothetical protein
MARQIKVMLSDREWWLLARMAERHHTTISGLLKPILQTTTGILTGKRRGDLDQRIDAWWMEGLDDGEIGTLLGLTRAQVARRRRDHLHLPANHATRTALARRAA